MYNLSPDLSIPYLLDNVIYRSLCTVSKLQHDNLGNYSGALVTGALKGNEKLFELAGFRVIGVD